MDEEFEAIVHTTPMEHNYARAFQALSPEALRAISSHFPYLDFEDGANPTARYILEQMWLVALTDKEPSQAPRQWVEENYAHLSFYDLNYVQRYWSLFLASARRLRSSVPFAHIEINASYKHPHLGITFYVPVVINGVAYVSQQPLSTLSGSPLYYQVAAQFTPWQYVFIEEVARGNAGASSTELLPSENPVLSSQVKWYIAVELAKASNTRLRDMVFVFDLEWNNHNRATRYVAGHIVDAHFEDLSTGWVPFTGFLKLPHPQMRLTDFLENQNYSTRELQESGEHISALRESILVIHRVCADPIFSAYNGINADLQVLQSAGIYLDHFIEATSYLTAGRSISLARLYEIQFGVPFSAHTAASDSQALLRLIRTRSISTRQLKQLYGLLQEMGASSHV